MIRSYSKRGDFLGTLSRIADALEGVLGRCALSIDRVGHIDDVEDCYASPLALRTVSDEEEQSPTPSVVDELAEKEDGADQLRERFRGILEETRRISHDDAEHTIATLLAQALSVLAGRLETIEMQVRDVHEKLDSNVRSKDWYTVAEVAEMLGRAEFTVREWCRLGRIYASKRACGRGPTQEWIIADSEIERIRNEGLLPM